MRSAPQFAMAIVLVLAGASMAAAQTASGTLNAVLINKSGITVMFNSDAAGVPLTGAGTATATLNFGTVAMYAPPPAGVTLTRTAGNFTVSSPFDVYVTAGGVASASYRVSAALQAPPGVFQYKFDASTLTTTAQTVVAADPNYNKDVQHQISLTVPATAPVGAVNNTINIVVTAN